MTKDIKSLLEYSNMTPAQKALADAVERLKNKKPIERTEETDISPTFKKELIEALKKTRFNTRAENQLKVAHASNYPVARLQGTMKAVAAVSNPLTTELEIVITLLDTVNGNNQGIRRSESANIIETAKHMPLRVNFDGQSIAGHVGSSVAGVITSVSDATDRIIGRALIWHENNDDLIGYIKSAAELYTSWEIYYTSVDRDSNGVSWLQNCIFAGTCLVSNPAYGKEHSKARITG